MSRASGDVRGEPVQLGDDERLAEAGSVAVGAGEAVVDVLRLSVTPRVHVVTLSGEVLLSLFDTREYPHQEFVHPRAMNPNLGVRQPSRKRSACGTHA